jgi:predicted MFS family arabinose efflux permease
VVVPLVARDVLKQGVEGFGFLTAVLGAGALSGAATLAQLARGRPPLAVAIGGTVVVSVGILTLAAIRWMWLAAPVLFAAGAAQILLLASANTTLQVTVPDELRSRVMSLYTLVFAGVSPMGALVSGGIAEAFGAPAACAASGGLGLACVLSASWARGKRTLWKERWI